MKNKYITLSLLGMAFALVFASPLRAQDNNNPPPKCEKCYRGPDGKMKCESVPCPKK